MGKPPQPSPVQIANALFVAISGAQYNSIEAAVEAAQLGTTVFVYPGIYTFNVPLPLHKGIDYQFLGTGTVKSSGPIFSDAGAMTDSYISSIFAPGWLFESEKAVVDFGAFKEYKALNFTFDSIVGGNPAVVLYKGTSNLCGQLIHSPTGTPLQVTGGSHNIKGCKILTESPGNNDGVLVGGSDTILSLSNFTVHATGTDGIGMDDGLLKLNNGSVVSNTANALTFRNHGKVLMSNVDVFGFVALTVDDDLVVESDDCHFKGIVRTADHGSPVINLRGGTAAELQVGAGKITVAGTVYDKGTPTSEWIPGSGWKNY